VDGVIDQRPSGRRSIYIQAKRNGEGNNIISGDLRDFFGAFELEEGQKGIFVTTSEPTPAAPTPTSGAVFVCNRLPRPVLSIDFADP